MRAPRGRDNVGFVTAIDAMVTVPSQLFQIGQFELDVEAETLRRDGRLVRLQPQPFRLLLFLVRRPGALVSREDIKAELWADGTYVDFDQAMNFAIKQVREALGDSAERPLYLQTVPRRGYRFIAPVEVPGGKADARSPEAARGPTTVRLEKALWANIADLRMAEQRRRRATIAALVAGAAILATIVGYLVLSR